jgi:hypothetical protein
MKDWLCFLSSYAPLWAMFALRFDSIWLRIGFGALAVLGVLITLLLLRRRQDERPSNTTIRVLRDGGAEISGYLAAYLLPFLTLAAPPLVDGFAYLIFFSVAGVIYVRSGLIQVNPTVYLFGWRVVCGSVALGAGGEGLSMEVYVFTRRDRRVGEALRGERFSDRVYIDHGAGTEAPVGGE